MSMGNLLTAFELISSNKAKADFVSARPDTLIEAAEQRLGLRFPPTYREFLRKLGAGNFGASEFYGIIDENFNHSSVPNGIWYTLTERDEVELPKNLIVIGDTGDGGLYCLEVSDEKEAPVIVF